MGEGVCRQIFCWKDHPVGLFSLANLAMTDVTLVWKDGKRILAHRVILSAENPSTNTLTHWSQQELHEKYLLVWHDDDDDEDDDFLSLQEYCHPDKRYLFPMLDREQLPLAPIQTKLLDHSVEANRYVLATVGCREGGNVGGPPVE